jgi:hypothetical protein
MFPFTKELNVMTILRQIYFCQCTNSLESPQSHLSQGLCGLKALKPNQCFLSAKNLMMTILSQNNFAVYEYTFCYLTVWTGIVSAVSVVAGLGGVT